MSSSWFEPLPARATYQAEAHAENRAALAEAAAAHRRMEEAGQFGKIVLSAA